MSEWLPESVRPPCLRILEVVMMQVDWHTSTGQDETAEDISIIEYYLKLQSPSTRTIKLDGGHNDQKLMMHRVRLCHN